MRYPTLGANVPAFALSYDVERDDRGNFRIAGRHLQSELRQFPSPWFAGLKSALETKLAKNLVVVGGLEQRYQSQRIERPSVIKDLLLAAGADAQRVHAVVSEPNTIGNAQAISKWCFEHQYDHDDAFVTCAYWHAPRAALDLRMQGIDMPLVPAEAIWLADSHTDEARQVRRNALISDWGQSDFAQRAAWECNGIADKLARAYESHSDRPNLVAAE